MSSEMLNVLFTLAFPILFLGTNGQDFNGQDLTCSATWGSSCEQVTPLISGGLCPEGFDILEDHCFKVGYEFVDWSDSKLRCEAINGAKLAEPRELLNSNVFAKYIWEQREEKTYSDDYSYYDYGGFYPYYYLGGHFTNNSWKWLTGGNINQSMYGDGCLSIYVGGYDYYYYENEYDGDSADISFSLNSYPCSNSYKDHYVCEAPIGNKTYSNCELRGTVYTSGQRVSMDTKQCQQYWCQDGNITQYTCGDITTNCCKYGGELYGDGDFIGSEVPTDDCSGCQQLVCQLGVVKWRYCTNCSVMCCTFNGESYQPGSYLQNTCAFLVCDGTTGQFINQGIDIKCPRCKAYLDPHIVTYEQRWSSYSYQGCGNYSLTQTGKSFHPTMAIYATFEPCGGSSYVTCVDTVTFKNDNSTVITITFDNSVIKMLVNGQHYSLPSFSPSIIKINETIYPVLAWVSGYDCLNLQGSSNMLVRFCGSSWSNQVYMWPGSDIAETLKGLCGAINNNNFTTRDEDVTWPWRRDAPDKFALSWLNSTTSNGNCGNGDQNQNIPTRVKRQDQVPTKMKKHRRVNTRQNGTARHTNGKPKPDSVLVPQRSSLKSLSKLMVEPRCEANSSDLNEIQYQCTSTVENGFPNAEQEESQAIIDDCVFDLCNVDDPDDWLRSVEETVQVQAVIQENTIELTTTTMAPTQPQTQPPTQPTTLPATSLTPTTSPPKELTTTTMAPTQPQTQPPTLPTKLPATSLTPTTSPPKEVTTTTMAPTQPQTQPPTQPTTLPATSLTPTTSPPKDLGKKNLIVQKVRVNIKRP